MNDELEAGLFIQPSAFIVHHLELKQWHIKKVLVHRGTGAIRIRSGWV
jgi:hypothetical protein